MKTETDDSESMKTFFTWKLPSLRTGQYAIHGDLYNELAVFTTTIIGAIMKP